MNDNYTDIYLNYNKALIYTRYNNPEEHSHLAAHIILSIEEPFNIIVDGKSYTEYGICIPSNCMHKIVDYKKPLLVFLYEETTGIAFASYVKISRLIRAYYDIFSGENITTSAMNAGFSSPSHFAMTSKVLFGVNAMEFHNKVKVHYIDNMK